MYVEAMYSIAVEMSMNDSDFESALENIRDHVISSTSGGGEFFHRQIEDKECNTSTLYNARTTLVQRSYNARTSLVQHSYYARTTLTQLFMLCCDL